MVDFLSSCSRKEQVLVSNLNLVSLISGLEVAEQNVTLIDLALLSYFAWSFSTNPKLQVDNVYHQGGYRLSLTETCLLQALLIFTYTTRRSHAMSLCNKQTDPVTLISGGRRWYHRKLKTDTYQSIYLLLHLILALSHNYRGQELTLG